jgi:hypothetical protein
MKKRAISKRVAAALMLWALFNVLAVYGYQADSFLLNPGLEPPYSLHGAPEVEVAGQWYPAWVPPSHSLCAGSNCVRPEYKPIYRDQFPHLVVEGGASQKIFATHAHTFGGVYQVTSLPRGKWRFMCDVYVTDDGKSGQGNPQTSARVGVHPWGGGMFDSAMVWGKPQVGERGWVYDQWVRVSVEAETWGDRATLAFSVRNDYPISTSAFFDNCGLERVEGEVLPTYTPYPTYTPAPTPTLPSIPPCDCPTPVPCPTFQPGVGCELLPSIRLIVREELDKTGLSPK